MPVGRSLHIGINAVDATQYEDGNGRPWSGALAGCEFDANDLERIAAAKGFSTASLLADKATSDSILKELEDAASMLDTGDIFFLTYSGHGSQMPDPDRDDPSGYDQTWVCYDRQLIDDELFARWRMFAPGVRIFVLSDSCHSGTITRLPPDEVVAAIEERGDPSEVHGARTRAMPRSVRESDSLRRATTYDRVRRQLQQRLTNAVGASVLLISGCQDHQTSADGDRNGRFTSAFRDVWDEGRFVGTYFDLYIQIRSRLPSTQQPNYYVLGDVAANFEEEAPLRIGPLLET